MQLHLVYRTYGGENNKDRPAYFSKMLALISFIRAASQVPGADIVFVTDGPVPTDRLEVMQRFGAIHQITGGPVGMRASYRYALQLPDLLGWDDDDVVSFNEDDYLFTEDAFLALWEAADQLGEVSYFALYSLWGDAHDPRARREFEIPHSWSAQPGRRVGSRHWTNIASTTSTFSARVVALRSDLGIFRQCTIPFRNRYLDTETCLLYQGHVPYHRLELLTGLPGDFAPSVRGVVRALFLLPFRVALNARARRQRVPHLLYALFPSAATHLTTGVLTDDQEWPVIASQVADWATECGLVDESEAIRQQLSRTA